MPARKIPQDVKTHWKLTFNMLNFALQYQPALQKVTSECEIGLCEYEMDNDEWAIAKELRDVLKAHIH
jgi:hypothetical protein